MSNANRSFWGRGIAILYGSFALFILGCVGFVSMQHADLVTSDYYQRGIEYQKEITKMKSADSLTTPPIVAVDKANRAIIVTFTLSSPPAEISGTLTLYRPSNSRWDKTVILKPGVDGIQTIPIDGFARGKWIVKLDWAVSGHQFYLEKALFIE